MVFLNLIVKKIDPSNIQTFMQVWMKQVCKDFRIVFLHDQDNSTLDEKLAVAFILRYTEMLNFKDNIQIVSKIDDALKSYQTRIFEDTHRFPTDKFEVFKLKTTFFENFKIKTETNKSQIIEKPKNQKQLKSVIKNPIDDQTDDDVTVAMATQPCRVDSYVNVVYELLPQCTRMCICFNGFDEIPKNLPKSPKIIAICANGKNGNPPDLGCDNKMFWVGKFKGYYATVDDDIIYPKNYIKTLKTRLKDFNNEIIVSFHGHFYKIKNGKINFGEREIFQYDKIHLDKWCHRLGMGVAMFHPNSIGLKNDVFLKHPKNTGDDEILSIWAQENKIPLLCISNEKVMMFSNVHLALSTGLCTNRESMKKRREFIQQYTKWKLIIPSKKYENINLLKIGNDDDVTVAMATQPHREIQMLNVVKQLLPQCTRICIALNEYDHIPEQLIGNPKIIAVLTGKQHLINDLGNLNKMLWLGVFPGYYATVDDDLNYFPGYIDKLKSSLKKYNNKAICSFHGLKFKISNGEIDLTSKTILFYNKFLDCDTQCLRPGMGTAMMHPSTIKIDKYMYLKYEKGNSDDVITSIWAQQHQIPCIVVERNKIYIDATDFAYNGLYKNKNIQLNRTKMMQSYKNWRYI